MDRRWLTRHQAAEYLGLKIRAFDDLARCGRAVKHFPAGTRTPRFDREQLDQMMISSAVPASE